MRSQAISSAALLAVLTTFPAAATVIDQEQPDISTAGLISLSFQPISQSFVPAATEIVGAGVYRTGSTNGDLTLAVFDALPGQGGTALASGTAPGTSGTGYVDVFFPALAVTPGATYYLVVTASNLDGITGNLILSGAINDPYPDGSLAGFPQFDLAFRTFAVPEPSTALLVALGLGALALRRGAVQQRAGAVRTVVCGTP